MSPMPRYTRRELLAAGATAALASCTRRKGRGFDGFVFVANQQGSNVAVVDLLAFNLNARIAVEGAPAAILGHAARRAVYVLCPEQGLLHEIDAARQRLRRTVRLPGPAAGMRMAPSGDALWVLSANPPALVQFPLDSLRLSARIRLPGPADDFDLSRDSVAAFSFRRENRIGLASLRASGLQATLAAPGEPQILRFRQDGRHLLAGDRAARRIGIWDVPTGRLVVNLPLPMEPASFCFTRDGGQLFVSGPGLDAVSIVYPYYTEVAETILAGRGPESMAVPDGPSPDAALPYLFVANPPAAAVTVLDVDTRKLVAVVGVGADPGQILFTPDGVYALVLNRGSGDLAIMRINSLRTEADGTTRRNNPSPLFALIPVGSRPVGAVVMPA